jgi:hypothetical protein
LPQIIGIVLYLKFIIIMMKCAQLGLITCVEIKHLIHGVELTCIVFIYYNFILHDKVLNSSHSRCRVFGISYLRCDYQYSKLFPII